MLRGSRCVRKGHVDDVKSVNGSKILNQAARTVFKKAREDERSNFHVYVATALMEYYSSKDKNVAFRWNSMIILKFG